MRDISMHRCSRKWHETWSTLPPSGTATELQHGLHCQRGLWGWGRRFRLAFGITRERSQNSIKLVEIFI